MSDPKPTGKRPPFSFGLISVALNMLFGDRGKLTMLLCGLTFASLLMALQASTFFGIMSWTYAPTVNIRAHIWVTDPKVEQINDAKPMRDTDVNRVRSVDGVAWAAPLHSSITQARLLDGNFKMIQLIGLDPDTLAGAPVEMVAGNVGDLRMPNTVIIDEFGSERLAKTDSVTGKPVHLGVGDSFELNDREARVVGICKAKRSFTGGPFVYTTYDRATTYVPPQRRMLSFVLAEPVAGETPEAVADRITERTGLRAWTANPDESNLKWLVQMFRTPGLPGNRDLAKNTFLFYWVNTGIPASFGTTILLGLFVGIAVSGQTFYSFVLDNLKYLAALKAMGASTFRLGVMLVFQACVAGLIGFGLGTGLAQALGRMMIKNQMPPFVMYPEILLITFALIMAISLFSALIGIVRVARLDPASVFRG